MRLIKQQVEDWTPTDYTLQGIYGIIERAGRVCYKSLVDPDADPKEFVDRLIKSKHTSVLEHGTMYFDIPLSYYIREDVYYAIRKRLVEFFQSNFWSHVNKYDGEVRNLKIAHYAVTTNYRVFEEQIDWEEIAGERWDADTARRVLLDCLCAPNEHHDLRKSVFVITDRVTSQSIIRHRTIAPEPSCSQESTRYCNYAGDKFNNELTFIIPAEYDLPEGQYYTPIHNLELQQQMWVCDEEVVEGDKQIYAYLDALQQAEDGYLRLIDLGWRAEQARRVLPFAVKTELILTGYTTDWAEFFDKRVIGTTGRPHMDIQQLASMIRDTLISL